MQIFSNIVANAIDAMPEGGLLRIHTKRRINPNAIEIEIADTGAGIQKTNLAKVFEPFFTTKGNLAQGLVCG